MVGSHIFWHIVGDLGFGVVCFMAGFGSSTLWEYFKKSKCRTRRRKQSHNYAH